MADRELGSLLNHLKSSGPALSYEESTALLSRAKRLLLQLNALTPSAAGAASDPALRALARRTYEQGALASIRARNPDAFTRYVAQLRPFYELLDSDSIARKARQSGARDKGGDQTVEDEAEDDDDNDGEDDEEEETEAEEEQNKVTGLYLLLLLTQGLYGDFHSELEALATRRGAAGRGGLEADRYLGYPIRLERWLMEGSYDRVWRAMKKGEVPCEEFGVFSEILTSQIRSEIASSSERAYPSLPLSSTKSLLFLDSEGAVVEFARARGWTVRDGHIYFPSAQEETAGDGEGEEEGDAEKEKEKEMSKMVIENTLGYARQLETIV